MLPSNNSLYTGENMLVIIDPAVSGYDQLAADVSPKAIVVILDPAADAITQITTALHSFSRPFSSLHIIVDCTPGTLHFSYADFSLRRLRAYVEQLQRWFVNSAYTPDQPEPQVFIYGERVANDADGQQFIDTLAWLTGASIATAAVQIEGQLRPSDVSASQDTTLLTAS